MSKVLIFVARRDSRRVRLSVWWAKERMLEERPRTEATYTKLDTARAYLDTAMENHTLRRGTWSNSMAILQLIVVPFIILNTLGVLGGAIWLAILGQWSLLGVGLLSMFFSATVIGIVTMPGTGITLLGAPLFGKRAWFLAFPFILAGSIYTAAVIAAWCLAVYLSY